MKLKLTLTALLAALVWAANWSLQRWGFIPIGFGIVAPAGVWAVGLSLGVRDALHEVGGKKWVIGAVALGAILSWWVAPAFAVASGAAFLIAESADTFVYAPLRERGWVKAVVLSNLVGAVLDSLVFLYLAFSTIEGWGGLTVGKMYATLIGLPIVWAARRAVSR